MDKPRFGAGTFVGDEWSYVMLVDRLTGKWDLEAHADFAEAERAYLNLTCRLHIIDRKRIVDEITRYWSDKSEIDEFPADSEFRVAYSEALL